MVTIFTPAELRVIKFCAEEVELQGDTPLHVYYMARTWEIALQCRQLTPEHVMEFGYLVKPSMGFGWRKNSVTINYMETGSPWKEIPRLINELFSITTLARLTPWEVFNEFERIHPLRDGNGRTGQIIYNWLRASMSDPERAEYMKH